MEKLEEILRAEEQARHALADAKTRARELRIEAASEAEVLIAQAGREGSQQAAVVTDAIMREAEAEAGRIEAASGDELAEFLQVAQSRLPDAVHAVLDELGR
ncbi:MAG: hypothetical protein RBS78_04085 [Coriobacteriia bacterium]|jgi:vacuolar-type H+-ATPase subunit H|nr:hypothetical protein [Coriobacteriia bacterium]